MNREKYNDREESSIDFIVLVKTVWHNKILVILSSILFTILAISISVFVLTPKYKSVTKLYIVSQQDSNKVTTQDLQLGNLLIKDYQEIILSNSVIDSVAKELNISYSNVRSSIVVSTPRDNRILSITGINKDPNLAATIANTVREKSINKIKDITKVSDITTIDEAEVSSIPYTPNIKKNAVVGLFFGLIFSILYIIGKEVLDDRVRYPEDVEEVMGEILLGVVPNINVKRKKNGSN